MSSSFLDLNNRSLEIFKEIVDTYVETGEPVGSRTISRRSSMNLSPATIRNIMADLEEAGLLYAPHTSAGRLPTDEGLRFFVHGLLQVGALSDFEKEEMARRCQASGKSLTDVLEEATTALSGLAKCAGIVMSPKDETPLKHIEFVPLSSHRALLVMITQDGFVENRVLELGDAVPASVLVEATNYMNSRLVGRTLSEAKRVIEMELTEHKVDLDTLSSKIVSQGIGVWNDSHDKGSLIIKGQANLLSDVNVMEDLEQIRSLFTILDTKQAVKGLLDASIKAEGVQIFIGAENPLFATSGCSLVIAPYHNADEKVIGAIGVVGPSRMNYGKIIPLVDYTAKLVSRMLS
ncbi:heat-inducible transcriptional repressor HrcA [Candidatus Paracaedibacter symbiosus]|uniref:heat-inducible transcriptional repressor HrcA n=1 Tax=Candidatus Paracaedibacter symbiosus TaxID=244582 RepID=UPI000509B60E|nr:heat-inducible transcriptional repressor HrcA [Candidatus Paracaedibacter symbiosus]